MQGINTSGKSGAVNHGTLAGGGAASKGSNLFAKKTEGINEAMNGQAVNTGIQLGKRPGIAGGSLNLIA